MNEKLEIFLDPVAPHQEPPFQEFVTQQLAVWLDKKSCGVYGHKTRSLEARERDVDKDTCKYNWNRDRWTQKKTLTDLLI